MNVVVLKTSDILVTVAKKSIVLVEVIVLKMSLVLTTVGQVEAVGHEVGQLVLWLEVTVIVVGGKNISVVEVTVDGEHEDGKAGHECGLECEAE